MTQTFTIRTLPQFKTLSENTDVSYMKPIWTSMEMNVNHNVTFSFFLDRLLVQLDETEKAFGRFWSKHHQKLNQWLQLQHFEHNFCEVLFSYLIELPFMFSDLWFSLLP